MGIKIFWKNIKRMWKVDSQEEILYIVKSDLELLKKLSDELSILNYPDEVNLLESGKKDN